MMDRTREHIRTHSGEWVLGTYQFRLSTPKARRNYTCDGCGEPIPKGMRHVNYITTNLEGPGWESWRLHGECYLEDGPMFHSDRPAWRWVGPVD